MEAQTFSFAMQSLALAHMDVADDTVSLSEWTETDFRTGGEKPIMLPRGSVCTYVIIDAIVSGMGCSPPTCG